MKREWLFARSGTITVLVSVLIWTGVAALAFVGIRAVDRWHRSSTLLVERRAAEIADLLALAVTRDMRAVQTSILESREWNAASWDPPYEANDLIASAFARYPYPDVFFGWTADTDTGHPVVFARNDRPPLWLPETKREGHYPVVVITGSGIDVAITSRIRQDIAERRQYSTFETRIAGVHYQAVARLLYDTQAPGSVSVFGFLVNIDWVRRWYFQSIADQVALIAHAGTGIECTVIDDTGQTLISARGATADAATTTRTFPVLFFDPVLIGLDPPPDLVMRNWSVRVSGSSDPTLAIAAGTARWVMVTVAAGVLTLGIGLFVTLRAGHAVADLAIMRADFVSTVTHELKTPVSVIRGIGETLIRGRAGTPERLREYSQLLVQESHRLSRLIENLLAYARVTDVTDVYSFERLHPAEVIDQVMKGFHRLLADGGFSVDVNVPEGLPVVRADATSLVLALDNLVDNAMRYSDTSRELTIRVAQEGRFVRFVVGDHGQGIPPSDLERVQRRFVRGRATNGHGSGLGLAIASRVASDHGGKLTLDSAVGVGTQAALLIPIAGAA